MGFGNQSIKEVKKTWGREEWIVNNELYCGKELFIKRKKWSSNGKYHYHKIKDETFFVLKGNLILDYVKGEDEFRRVVLEPGQAFRLLPMTKHRFSTDSLIGCKFIEFSTKHMDEDSYRCYYNEETGHWIED